MLDNGAKWKDLPRRFGSKSTVHRWFQKWVAEGVFEQIMRAAGRCVEERDGYRLYECFIDGSFSKAKGGGDGIGCTRVGKGVKIMVLVDASGLPDGDRHRSANRAREPAGSAALRLHVAPTRCPSASSATRRTTVTDWTTTLAARGSRNDRTASIQPTAREQNPGWSTVAPLQTALDRRTHHRLDSELPPALHPLGEIHGSLPRLPSLQLHAPAAKAGFGIASSASWITRHRVRWC